MSNKILSADLLPLTSDHITINDGVADINAKEITGQVYEKFGTDAATVKTAYDAVAAAGNTIAQGFSEKAQDFLKDNPNTTVVTGTAKIGEETWKMATHRSQTHINPQSGEKVESKGGLTVSRVISTRKSELKSIKQLAKERGIKTL